MGSCLSACRSKRNNNAQETNNTTQNHILSNQLGPNAIHKESNAALNNKQIKTVLFYKKIKDN